MASTTRPETVFDAVIKGAWITTLDDGSRYARGQMYYDRKGRYEDGHPIYTSLIESGPDADGIIKTMNSTYKLEMRDDTDGG